MRLASRVGGLIGVLIGSLVLGASGAVAAPAPEALPEHRQVVTVRVDDAAATAGILEAWRWDRRSGAYRRVLGPVPAFVGEDGVGRASEYVARTPAGTFTLTEAFGIGDPPARTALPYRRTSLASWWVSDVSSPLYNTFQTCAPGRWCGFRQDLSEQLGAIRLYRPAIVIDYNRDPVVPGAGSAFFVHRSEGRPTQGCVSVDPRPLRAVLRWLRPAAAPIISIGVGDRAYAPLSR